MTLSQMRFRSLRNEPEQGANLAPLPAPSTSYKTESINRTFGSTASIIPPEIFTPPTGSLNAAAGSAATSFMEDAKTSSPDLFPTQDAMEIEADEHFRESFKQICEPTKADLLFEELCAKTPFKNTGVVLPHKLMFRHRYELERVANALQSTPEEILKDLTRKGISSKDDYDKFWNAGRLLARERDQRLPEKSSSTAWKRADEGVLRVRCQEAVRVSVGSSRLQDEDGRGSF
jgi:hypothetical protein